VRPFSRIREGPPQSWQPSNKNCHPERSRTIREASRSAESKDPYPLIDRRVAQAFDLAWHKQHKGWPIPSRTLRRGGNHGRRECRLLTSAP
jgi:hypothetical protein